ncbi:Uncharacterised protein [uncultured archaeon]|nr:Uncharacterised protein [uncultured archaeon]
MEFFEEFLCECGHIRDEHSHTGKGCLAYTCDECQTFCTCSKFVPRIDRKKLVDFKNHVLKELRNLEWERIHAAQTFHFDGGECPERGTLELSNSLRIHESKEHLAALAQEIEQFGEDQ